MDNKEQLNEQPSLQDNQKDVTKVTVPVIEEHVTIEKKVIETGVVRLSKRVKEEIQSFDVPLSGEETVIERIPKNEIVDKAPPAFRQEGDVTVFSVVKEVAVVEKRLMLVEEIRVTKKQVQKTETVDVTVRKEEVYIDRT